MYEMVIFATGFGEFEFFRTFWHLRNLNFLTLFDVLAIWIFPHFLTIWEFEFPALFDIFEISIWIFPYFLGGQEQKRKSAGKFNFTESCSEYHHFTDSLCFRYEDNQGCVILHLLNSTVSRYHCNVQQGKNFLFDITVSTQLFFPAPNLLHEKVFN